MLLLQHSTPMDYNASLIMKPPFIPISDSRTVASRDTFVTCSTVWASMTRESWPFPGLIPLAGRRRYTYKRVEIMYHVLLTL